MKLPNIFSIFTRGKTDTSVAAEKSVRKATPGMRQRVLAYIKEDPATTDEVCNALKMPVQTVTARVWELRKAGLIKDSGQRRLTSRGRNAIVWKVV